MAGKLSYEELEQKVKELEREAGEHKQAKDALRESEERWRSLTETAPFVILTAQRDGTIQFLNRTATNNTTESRIGTKIFDYIQPDYHSVIRKAIDYVFQTSFPTSYESFGTGPKGPSSAWYLTHVGPVFRDGRVVAVTMASTDITEAKKVHEALQVSEAQKKAILDAAFARIRLSDTNLKIIWANQTHERELNMHPEELIGKHCYTVFVKRDTPCPECPSIKAITSGKMEHAVLARPSIKDKEETTYLDSYAVPLKNESGDIESCIQITRNITQQVQAEKELHQSEEKFRTLFENSRDPVYITTREGEIIEVNQSFLDLFSLRRDEIPDINVQQLYVNANDRKTFQKQIERKGSVTDFEVKLKRKDGEQIDCLFTSTMWRASDGSTLGYQGIIRDITERKKAERALREREKELKIQATNLEEVNTALQVLLKRRDEDKKELEEKVLSNVKELVVPYVEKLEKTGLNTSQKTYVDILKSNLNDIISPFIRTLSSTYLNISPTEIQVADLVKQGKTTKEIAALLHSSPRAIEFHRNNLRNKLGLKNTKANLRSYLLSLT
jgi:PAS domain S-box-containing protein